MPLSFSLPLSLRAITAGSIVALALVLAGCTADQDSPQPAESPTPHTQEAQAPRSTVTVTETAAPSTQSTHGSNPQPVDSQVPLYIREKLMSATIGDVVFYPGQSFTLVNGQLRMPDNGAVGLATASGGFASTPSEIAAWQGEIDNEPGIDIIAAIASGGGGSGTELAWYIFDEDANVKVKMPAVEDMKIYRGGYNVEGVDGPNMSMTWYGYQDTDAMCCPSLNGSGTYKWNGTSLVAVDGPYFSPRS